MKWVMFYCQVNLKKICYAKGQVIFEEMDQVKWNNLKSKLLRKGMDPKDVDEDISRVYKELEEHGEHCLQALVLDLMKQV